MHRYAPPLPYGGWVLSLAILFTGFFIFRAEGADESVSEAEHSSRRHGDEQEGRAHNTPSQAYQTDEEVLSKPLQRSSFSDCALLTFKIRELCSSTCTRFPSLCLYTNTDVSYLLHYVEDIYDDGGPLCPYVKPHVFTTTDSTTRCPIP